MADDDLIRQAFDSAFDAADALETRQRLDGLTRALPVARIEAPPEHAAVASVRTLLEERDQAVAAWRQVERELEMARVTIASLQRRLGPEA